MRMCVEHRLAHGEDQETPGATCAFDRDMRFLLVFVAACTSAAPLANHATPTPPPRPAHTPTSVDEGMAVLGMTRVQLGNAGSKQDTSGFRSGEVVVMGRYLSVVEERGFHSARSIFARRPSDGAIVLVQAWPHRVVDRHVQRACQRFAGGRGWFETVRYQLPEGERYGGAVRVPYDQHVETVDYANQERDGSPCPPPALD
jgi:hypothetical protein